jgi:hypothetical protein
MYLWKQGFFITNAEQTQRLAQHHVEERLVILIRDFAAVNSFTSIFIQLGREKPTNKGSNLHLEDMVVEEILQLLIRKVDQKLFKAVVLKALKSKNVEDT